LLRHICTERCFFQAEDGIRDVAMTRVQTCAIASPTRGKGEMP